MRHHKLPSGRRSGPGSGPPLNLTALSEAISAAAEQVLRADLIFRRLRKALAYGDAPVPGLRADAQDDAANRLDIAVAPLGGPPSMSGIALARGDRRTAPGSTPSREPEALS